MTVKLSEENVRVSEIMSIHSPGGSTLANVLTNVISETLTLSSESFMTSAVVFSIMLLTSNVVIHKQRNKVTNTR